MQFLATRPTSVYHLDIIVRQNHPPYVVTISSVLRQGWSDFFLLLPDLCFWNHFPVLSIFTELLTADSLQLAFMTDQNNLPVSLAIISRENDGLKVHPMLDQPPPHHLVLPDTISRTAALMLLLVLCCSKLLLVYFSLSSLYVCQVLRCGGH